MLHDAAAAFAAEKLAPSAQEAYLEVKTDPAIFHEMCDAGLSVFIPEEYGGVGAGYVSCGWVAREVERRFRLPLDDKRAVLAGHATDPCLRLGRAAQEVPAQARFRRVDRLLRLNRAGCGLRRRRREDPREEDRKRLCAEWLQDADLQRADR